MSRLDNERVSLPVSGGVSDVRRHRLRAIFSQVDHTSHVILLRPNMNAIISVGDLHRRRVEHVCRDARPALQFRVVRRGVELRRELAAMLRQQSGILLGPRPWPEPSGPDPENPVRGFFRGANHGRIERSARCSEAFLRPTVLAVAIYEFLSAGQKQMQ